MNHNTNNRHTLGLIIVSISPCIVITYFLQLGLDLSMKGLNPMCMELHGQVEENNFENVVPICNIFYVGPVLSWVCSRSPLSGTVTYNCVPEVSSKYFD